MTQAAADTDTDLEAGAQGGQAEGTEQQQQQQAAGEQHAAGGEGGEGAQGEGAGEAGDEVVVTIGEESPTSEEDENRAPEWVRELRKSNREKDRRIRELEAKVNTQSQGQQPAAVVVGEEPTLEGCDYDATKFTREWKAWNERKAQADQQKRETEEAQKKQQEAWQATLQSYGEEKSALKVKDYDEAEEVVRNTLSVVQQGIVLDGVEKGRRAALVYALGKNPKKAQELAAIANPIKFAFAVAKLETQLKVTPRKSVPAPERRIQSTVAGAAAVEGAPDKVLENLRAEAAKTGDLSKVVAYKRQQRQAHRG